MSPTENLKLLLNMINEAQHSVQAERFLRQFIAGIAKNKDCPTTILIGIAKLVYEARCDELIDVYIQNKGK